MATTVQNNIPHTTVEYEYDPFGSAFNVTVTCETGYTIKGTPTMTVGGDAFSEVELTVADNKQSATGSIESETEDTSIELHGETESGSTPVEPVIPTVENNIPNTDYEAVFDTSTSQYKVIVTVTCKTGYQLVGAPIVSIIGDAFSEPVTLNVSSDKLTATGEIEVYSINNSLQLDGNTELISVVSDVTVTNNITGTTESHTYADGTVTIRIVCTDTRKRYVGCKASYGDVSVDFPVTDSNDITVTLENVPTGANITLTGECRYVASVETDYLTGCTITGIKPWYVENETVTATLTANKGTYFNTVPQMQYTGGSGFIDTKIYDFTVSEDKKTATISQKLEFSKESVELATISFVGSTVPEKTVTGYGSINVYSVNDSILKQFSESRFQSATGEVSLAYDTDLGDYVNKLHKVYCDVGEVTETTIKCGNYDTLIKAESINEPVVTVDFGNVTLPVNNSDSSDFNATVKVFVPFKGFVAVDADFIGKTLNLKYDVDLITGDGCYKISVGDVIISQDVVKVSSDVIYKTSKNMNLATIGSSGFSTDYLKGLKPFVVMKYYEPLQDRYNNDNSVKVLSDVTGFAKFKDITLPTIDCLNSEYNEIVSLLSKGVIL